MKQIVDQISNENIPKYFKQKEQQKPVKLT